MEDLRNKFTNGAAWMLAMRFSVNLLAMISTIFLARLLTPEDFGLVALASSAYIFLSIVGQLGFDSALIHHPSPSKDHYDSAWTANIAIGLTIAAGMVLVAKPASSFFEEPRIESIIYVMSILSLAKGFENIGVVNFRKNLTFAGDFGYFVIPKITSVLSAIPAAFILRSYWALVIGMIVGQVSSLIFSHLSQPFRPRFSVRKTGELLGFSKWILANNLLKYLSENSLDVILGRMSSTAAVGIFGMGRQIAFMPTTELMAPINRALFPSLSAISDRKDRLRSAVYKVLGVTVVIALPMAFGIAAVSDLLVLSFFGEKWGDAAPVLEVLALAGVVMVIRGPFWPVLLARGKPRAQSAVTIVDVCIVVPLSIFLVPSYGPVGVAIAVLTSALLTFPLLFSAVRREIDLTFRSIVAQIWRPLAASLVMYLFVKRAQDMQLADGDYGLIELFFCVFCGTLLYTIGLALLWWTSGRPDSTEFKVLQKVIAKYRVWRQTS